MTAPSTKVTRWHATLVLSSVLLCSPVAQAAGANGPDGIGKALDDFSEAMITAFIITEVAIAAPALIAGGHNLHSALESDALGTGWYYAGMIAGVVNVVVGLLWVIGSAIDGKTPAWVVGAGAGNVAVGGMAIGFTLWADTAHPSLSLAPVVFPTRTGSAGLGWGLRLTNW